MRPSGTSEAAQDGRRTPLPADKECECEEKEERSSPTPLPRTLPPASQHGPVLRPARQDALPSANDAPDPRHLFGPTGSARPSTGRRGRARSALALLALVSVAACVPRHLLGAPHRRRTLTDEHACVLRRSAARRDPANAPSFAPSRARGASSGRTRAGVAAARPTAEDEHGRMTDSMSSLFQLRCSGSAGTGISTTWSVDGYGGRSSVKLFAIDLKRAKGDEVAVGGSAYARRESQQTERRDAPADARRDEPAAEPVALAGEEAHAALGRRQADERVGLQRRHVGRRAVLDVPARGDVDREDGDVGVGKEREYGAEGLADGRLEREACRTGVARRTQESARDWRAARERAAQTRLERPDGPKMASSTTSLDSRAALKSSTESSRTGIARFSACVLSDW